MNDIEQRTPDIKRPVKVEQASGLFFRASRPKAAASERLPFNGMSADNRSCRTKSGATPNLTGETPVPPDALDVGYSKLNVQRSHFNRAAIARDRAIIAHAMLADCHFCAHHCGVNRLTGTNGFCHAGAKPRFFSVQIEVSDELEIIPTFAIALSGCDLRCDFCITGAGSWNPRAGEDFGAEEMAARAKAALQNGARTIMVLGGEPTIHLPTVLDLVAALPDSARLIWKTNAHGSAEARELLGGMFDIWLADFKFGNDACARRLARIPDYRRIVEENLTWAHKHSELIVRHLLMPGHVECCWRTVADWLAEYLPGAKVNLRSGFWPAWHAARHRELRGTVPDHETKLAWKIAGELELNLIH